MIIFLKLKKNSFVIRLTELRLTSLRMMFIVRKLFRKNKQFTNYICTNSILNDKKSNEQKFSNEKSEKNAKEPRSSSVLKQKTDNLSSDASPNSINFSNSKKKRINQTASALQFDPFKTAAESLVKDVAKELGGNKKKITEELLSYLKTLDVYDDSRERAKNKINLYAEKDFDLEKGGAGKNFFKEKLTLGIFNKKILEDTNQVKLKIWDDLEAEELAYLSKCPPKNYFEELISWTNEGKLWHFPIDNDQGLDEEAKISFTEHIFMEQYLEPWCPQRGPLRKFMELILIGLSKNPYLTVEEKKSHIQWFRNYFENKKKLLQELGAMGPPKEIEVPKQE